MPKYLSNLALNLTVLTHNTMLETIYGLPYPRKSKIKIFCDCQIAMSPDRKCFLLVSKVNHLADRFLPPVAYISSQECFTGENEHR